MTRHTQHILFFLRICFEISLRSNVGRSKEFQFWKFGTINVQSAKDDWRLENAIRHVANAKLSFCAFQEVRRPTGNTIISHKSSRYEVHWSGYAAKSQAGVGIAIKITPGIEIIEVENISARIITASLNLF